MSRFLRNFHAESVILHRQSGLRGFDQLRNNIGRVLLSLQTINYINLIYMNGFTIKNFQDTASFELEITQRDSVDDLDGIVRTKYEFHERTIMSARRWYFGLGEVSWFMKKVISMYDNLKGCASFTSFEDDELYLEIDEYGHIDVTVKDGIASYNGRVEFSFQIDQSYLPELIEQLKRFIETNR